MSLGNTFQERYLNFFNFFSNSSRTIEEIDSFIHKNNIPNFSQMKRIHLNMIDMQNLNILFHIIRKSNSDNDCLEKLKLLIEKYHVKYNLFDSKHHRTLPFYTCVKGYLESTKYLIEKMNYDINFLDFKEETLFFSAFRSYNIELVKYLDEKYKNWIFYPNGEYNSCIYYIFKDSIKKEGEKNIKDLLRFIINKGFNIDEKNKNNFSFRDLCSTYGIINYLEDVLKERQNIEKEQKLLHDKVYININENYIITSNDIKEFDKNENEEKINEINESLSSKNNNNNKIIENSKEESEIKNEIDNQDNQIITNKKIEINNIKNINENRMIDSDNSSLNNISIISSEKNKKDGNKNNDIINDQLNDDFYSFSEYSGLYFNNGDIVEKKEKQKNILKADNKEKNERKKKCCVFVNSLNHIVMDEILDYLNQKKNLKIYLDKIIICMFMFMIMIMII